MSGALSDKVAVVTGSGQGIGRGIAVALAEEGARVVTNSRRPGTPGGDAETVAHEIMNMGGQAVPFLGDVSEFEVAAKLIKTAVDNFGTIDILVNNVGVHPRKDVWDLKEEDWDSTIKSHLKSAFNCTRHACVLMKERRWGRIINCVSGTWLGNPGMCNYGAAKAGIVGLTRCVARDLGKYGVTCNAYDPRASTRRTRIDSPDGPLVALRKRYELGLITKQEFDFLCNMPPPEAVGPFVAYLATEEAGGINGQIFYVAGGHVAIYSEPQKMNSMVKEKGFWTVDELIEMSPKILLKGYKNPVPLQIKE